MQGPKTKMSASTESSAIFMTDDENQLKLKINKYAFSGGKDNLEEHRKLGGNPEIDVPYQYLSFFEPDDEKLEKIYNEYKSGKLLSGEIKNILFETLKPFIKSHQESRNKVTEEMVTEFMTPRSLEFRGKDKIVN